MKEFKRLILAMQFMTRIPIPLNIEIKKDELYKTASYFPAVGIIIGFILSLLYIALVNLFSREIVMTLVVAFSYILTGAMHIDGLADTFDGLFSNKDKERMLEIMRDSRLGTNGVVATVFMIILKVLFFVNINENMTLPSLLVMPMLGRLASTFAILISKSARGGEGLGGLMIGRAGMREFLIALVISLVAGFFIMPFSRFAELLTIVLLVSFIITKYISMRIGGMTGDTLGAVTEITELVVLIMVYLLIKSN